MNRTVKLYRSVKCASGAWGTKAVPDKQLMNLKDLHEGEGNYYLAYYEGKHRQMPPVGRFADAAKQKLIQKRKQLDARASGVQLPSEPESETKAESNLVACVEKYLSQMMSFVGNDGYILRPAQSPLSLPATPERQPSLSSDFPPGSKAAPVPLKGF
jgi:hypothetical protein